MGRKKVKLSARAEALLLRVKRGDWYEAFPETQRGTPKAMQELVDAGLVNTCGRAKVLVLCYVPTGYRYRGESWPDERKARLRARKRHKVDRVGGGAFMNDVGDQGYKSPSRGMCPYRSGAVGF